MGAVAVVISFEVRFDERTVVLREMYCFYIVIALRRPVTKVCVVFESIAFVTLMDFGLQIIRFVFEDLDFSKQTFLV